MARHIDTLAILLPILAATGLCSVALAQDSAQAAQEQAAPPAKTADAGPNPLTHAIEHAQAKNSAADTPESSCFTLGSDDPPAEGQKLVIPKQVICPFIRLPLKD